MSSLSSKKTHNRPFSSKASQIKRPHQKAEGVFQQKQIEESEVIAGKTLSSEIEESTFKNDSNEEDESHLRIKKIKLMESPN